MNVSDPAALPPTARRILAAAQSILAERGYAELTMTAIAQVSGANRALVSYYFGGKAGLLAALVETLFLNPDVGYVEEIRATRPGTDRADAFLEWQQRVSANDRTNRMLYELLPHALREPGGAGALRRGVPGLPRGRRRLPERRAARARPRRSSKRSPRSASPWSRASASSGPSTRTASTTRAPGACGAT